MCYLLYSFISDNNSEHLATRDTSAFPLSEPVASSSSSKSDGLEIAMVSSSDLSFLDGLAVPLVLPRSHTPPERDTNSKELIVKDSEPSNTRGIENQLVCAWQSHVSAYEVALAIDTNRFLYMYMYIFVYVCLRWKTAVCSRVDYVRWLLRRSVWVWLPGQLSLSSWQSLVKWIVICTQWVTVVDVNGDVSCVTGNSVIRKTSVMPERWWSKKCVVFLWKIATWNSFHLLIMFRSTWNSRPLSDVLFHGQLKQGLTLAWSLHTPSTPLTCWIFVSTFLGQWRILSPSLVEIGW